MGLAEPPEDGTEEATEDEDIAPEPNYTFAKGYGRFGIGYTRLATALGNFEQGNIQAESAVVAQWLTSGLRVAMSRTGWNLLSPRYMLTKVPGVVLSDYYCHGYPFTPKMADRPYNQYGPHLYSEDRWDQLCMWLTGNSQFRIQLAGHKQALRDHMGYSQEASDPSNKARRTALTGHYAHPAFNQLQRGMSPYTTFSKRALPVYSFIRLRCLPSPDYPLQLHVSMPRRVAVRQIPMFPVCYANEGSTPLIAGSLSVR